MYNQLDTGLFNLIIMKWLPIDRDENGFATEECLDRIFNNLPCAVCSQTEGGYKYYNFVNEYLDMCHNREEIRNNTGYTHYLPIPKYEYKCRHKRYYRRCNKQ